LDYILKW